jgi:hypothetical protein
VQLEDTSSIQRLIGKARFRIRAQWALEGATTALILASAFALVAIFAIRAEWVSFATGMYMVAGAVAIVIAGAIAGAAKKLDDEMVARRIDRASNLSDRLSTAIAFRRSLATAGQAPTAEDETTDMMIAAIRDGVRAVPRANLRAASPFVAPRDLRAAAGFVVVSALCAGLALPTVDRTAKLFRADPDHAPPGAEVIIYGENLMTGIATPVATLPTKNVLGAPEVPPEATSAPGFVPNGASVFMGAAEKARPVVVLDWTRASIRIRIPADAPIGDTVLTAHVGDNAIGPVSFTVVDPKDVRYHNASSVQLDPDERAYVEAILAELKRIAKRDGIEDLEKFASRIEKLLEEAEQGKITKEQLLEELAKAEAMLNEHAEMNPAEVNKQLSELSKELEKNKDTKDLAKALKDNKLDEAKKEMEKLAEKMDPKALENMQKELEKQLADKNLSEQEKAEIKKQMEEMKKQQELQDKLNDKTASEQEKKDAQKQLDEMKKQNEQKQKDVEKQLQDKNLSEQQKQDLQKKLDELKKQQAASEKMTEKQKEQLQKTLQDVAKQMEKQQKDQQQKSQEQQQKLENEIRRLQKEKEQAKTEQQKTDAERRLDKAKQELQKLQKEDEQKQQSAQREAVKRLQKDIEKAAENMQKPQNKQESQEEQEERERQASQKMKDAARETGRVDQDQRKQATQKKMSSQMDDLREAMRRAKQKGNKGPNDPFNKNGKNKDFQARARGQKGNGQSWKPGQGQQGQGQGQGQGNQPGGKGQGQGGDSWGEGHDPNLTGDATSKSGNQKDQDLQGTSGGKGGSTRETILAAAQKGFASRGYQKVYQDYQRIVEEVMRNEKLPSSYKYYVKRYFAKIHPSGAQETIEKGPE